MIKLFVVDDQELIISSIEEMVFDHPDIEVIGTAQSGEDALKIIPSLRVAKGDVFIVMLDFLMRMGINGLVLSKRLRALLPDVKIIMLTNFTSRELMAKSIDYVDGFISKSNSITVIIEAIERVSRGEWIVYGNHGAPDEVPGLDMPILPEDTTPPDLSGIQEKIICMVVEGLPNREIVQRTGWALKIVERQKEIALSKLGAKGKPLAELKQILQFYGICD